MQEFRFGKVLGWTISPQGLAKKGGRDRMPKEWEQDLPSPSTWSEGGPGDQPTQPRPKFKKKALKLFFWRRKCVPTFFLQRMHRHMFFTKSRVSVCYYTNNAYPYVVWQKKHVAYIIDVITYEHMLFAEWRTSGCYLAKNMRPSVIWK